MCGAEITARGSCVRKLFKVFQLYTSQMYSVYPVYTAPRCTFFWANFFDSIHWKRAWLRPEKFCISNKIREVHFKILHNVYPTNSQIASFFDLSNLCVFCKVEEETLLHLFFYCNQVKSIWENLICYLSSFIKCDLKFSPKDIFLYFSGSDHAIDRAVNFFVLHCSFFIHKTKFLNTLP